MWAEQCPSLRFFPPKNYFPDFRNTANTRPKFPEAVGGHFNNGVPGKHKLFQEKSHTLILTLFPSPRPPLNPLPSHLHISTSLPPSNLSLRQHLLGLRSCLEFLQCQYYTCSHESEWNRVHFGVAWMSCIGLGLIRWHWKCAHFISQCIICKQAYMQMGACI